MEFSRKGRCISTYGRPRASTDPGGCPRHTDMAEAVPGGPKGFWATVQSSGILVITCKRTGWKVFPKCATSKRDSKDRWVTTPGAGRVQVHRKDTQDKRECSGALRKGTACGVKSRGSWGAGVGRQLEENPETGSRCGLRMGRGQQPRGQRMEGGGVQSILSHLHRRPPRWSRHQGFPPFMLGFGGPVVKQGTG